MKKIYSAVLFFLIGLSCYGQEYAGSVRLVQKTMEERGNDLYISFEIAVKADALNKCQSWRIIPELRTPDKKNSVTFPYILINGKNKRQQLERKTKFGSRSLLSNKPYMTVNVSPGLEETLFYEMTVPYQMWMDTASLEIRQVLTSCREKQQLFTVEMGSLVKLESRIPYEVQPLVNFILPAQDSKQRSLHEQAFLNFRVATSVLLPEYRNNSEELARIREAVDKVRRDPELKITGIPIIGYASPEENHAFNERLARDRASVLRVYMRRTLGIPDNLFSVSSVAEDWDGLRALVEESTTLPDKERVLRIIDSNDDPDRKEQRLKTLGATYQYMLREMYPKLRRVECQIDFTVKDYTLEESKALAGKNPQKLSQRELFLVAQEQLQGSESFNQMIDLIVRLYPDDPTANINAAAAMLLRGENSAAKRHLDKAGDIPAAFNNRGVYYLRNGNLDEAQQLFTKASVLGVEQARHNLGEVEKKRQDNLKRERHNRR